VEGGQDLLRADIQVQAELRFVCVGDREIEEETTNAGMVQIKYIILSEDSGMP
jgi:hypothetical protein